MTFSTIETSIDDGRPIELYQFSYTGNAWFYTSADRSITYNSNDYRPVPIMRSSLRPTADATKADLTITVTGDSPLGEIFRIQPPSEPVIVTITGQHYLDNSYTVVWKGRIIGAEWKDGGTLDLISENVFSSLQRLGLRRRYQAQCPFALYGEDCGVDRDIWKQAMVASSISGLILTATGAIGAIDNWYGGGYVTWVNSVNGNTEKRMIRSSVGATGALELSALPIGLNVGQAITVYPGCDHTLEGANGCGPKFINFVRFGGTPFIPSKNPFNGSSVY